MAGEWPDTSSPTGELPGLIASGHVSPVVGDYAVVGAYGRDQAFVSPALGGREVRVAELLGSSGDSGA